MFERTFPLQNHEVKFLFDEQGYLMIDMTNIMKYVSSRVDGWIIKNKDEISLISHQFGVPTGHLFKVTTNEEGQHIYWFHELLALQFLLTNSRVCNFKCWLHVNSLKMHALKNYDASGLSKIEILEIALESERSKILLENKLGKTKE